MSMNQYSMEHMKNPRIKNVVDKKLQITYSRVPNKWGDENNRGVCKRFHITIIGGTGTMGGGCAWRNSK